jgi:hypothetical protein
MVHVGEQLVIIHVLVTENLTRASNVFLQAVVQLGEQSVIIHEARISRILSDGGGYQTVYC